MSVWTNKKLWAGFVSLALLLPQAGQAADRVVRAVDMSVARGQTNHLFIELEAEGNESGLQTSLCYDQNLLTYSSAVRGADAADSTFIINTTQLAGGRLGLLLALQPGEVFPAGTRSLIRVTFVAAPGGASATSSVNFCDEPLVRELSDLNGDGVAANYSNAVVTILGSCTYSLSPTNRPHGYGAATNTVVLTAGEGCAWTLVNTNSWITFTTATTGSGSATNTYTVAANTNLSSRTGVVQIGLAGSPQGQDGPPQVFTVTQSPFVCGYSLSPRSRAHGPGAASNSVGVSTTAGCDWAATTTNGWITLLSGASGSGDGTVNYAVAANPVTLERVGAILVADQTLVLTQRAATCSQTLSPTSASHGTNADTGSFGVSTPGGCAWTVSTAISWITITSATSGNGNGTVTYSIEANASGAARSGVIAVAGSISTNNFTINQSGQGCAFTLSATNGSHAGTTGSGSVGVTTLAGCAWAVVNTNNWITITSATNSTGSGTVTYSVSGNPEMTPRSGSLVIGLAGSPQGQEFTVTQAGFICAYSLSPQSRNHGPGMATNAFTLTTSNGCPWAIVNTNGWITITSAATGTGGMVHAYTVAANSIPAWRTGVVQIADATFTIKQQPFVCSFSISPRSRSHGPGAASNSVSVTTSAACSWTATTTNGWINIVSGASGQGNGTAGYTVAMNMDTFERIGAILIADQSLVITQRAASCSYTLTPAGGSHGAGADTGGFNVSSAAGCAWTAVTTNSWITITGGASGSATGAVAYSVTANPAGSARSGIITAGGRNFSIDQAGQACSFTLSSTNAAHGGAVGTGTVSVATLAGCVWTTVSSNSWITIISATTNTGSDTVAYRLSGNPDMIPRSGVIVIAGQVFTVTQAGFVCAYELSPQNRNHGSGAATNTVSLTTSNGCDWTIVNTNGWITFTTASSGSGSATHTYTVAANPNPFSRTGVVLIADQAFTINQQPASCSFSLSPRGRSHGPGAATNSVSVTTTAGCSWSAGTTNGWITILSGATGQGTGVVSYAVSANPDALERIGAIMVADQSLVLTQRAASCSVSVSPNSASHGAGAENGSINLSVAGGCPWSVNATSAWVTITSATNGSGDGIVTYAIVANPAAGSRSAVVTVSGVSNQVNFTIHQAAQACTFTLSATNATHGGGSGTGTVTVTTLAGCSWTVDNTNGWITITSSTNQTGSDAVNYAVSGNPDMTSRSGVLVIAGQGGPPQVFTVTQAGFACAYDLSPPSRTHGPGMATNTISLTTSNSCAWTLVNNSGWITFTSAGSGSGGATHTYIVAANPNPAWRTGVVQIADATFTIHQQPVVCGYSLSPRSRSHGPGTATNSVSITTSAGCDWTAASSNNWITILSATNGQGTGSVSYAVEANPNALERIGHLLIADQSLVLTQRAATCTYVLSPASASHGAGTASGSINITAPGGCAWTVDNTNSWITITSSTNGSGTGAATYSVESNSTAVARAGIVVIAGESGPPQVFAIDQSSVIVACAYRISPTNRTHGAGAATNSVSLTVSNGCAWTVVNTNGWITITSPTSGSGAATISYAVEANPTLNERTGLVMIADQVLTLIQHGVTCDFSISPTNRTHGYSAATNSVMLTAPAGCVWTIANTNAWITITSPANGAGNATVNYTVDENAVLIERTGLVMIADQVLTLVQRAAPCLYELSPTNRLHGPTSATGLVSVATSPTCDWVAATTNGWITITSAASGTGNGSVGYSIQANPTGMPRTGLLTIGDESFPVIQSGAPCSYSIAPSSRGHGGGMETGTVSVTSLTGCAWTTSNTNDWITILGSTNGSGGGTKSYSVDPNPSLSPRSGTFIIAGQVFTVSQQGFTCAFRLSPTNRTHGAGAATNSVSVTTSNGCDWTVVNTNDWIAITSATSGSGSGSVGYTVDENLAPSDRTGIVLIGGQPFMLTQRAAQCDVTISPSSRMHGYGTTTGTVVVTTLAGCDWPAVNTNEWITILSTTNGSGSNVLTYALTANPTMMDRTGSVLIADQVLTVRQLPAPCTYELSTMNRTHGHSAATNSVTLTTPMGCPWTVANTNDWIIIAPPTNGSNSATISYRVEVNPVTFSRTGVVMIAGELLTLRQLPAPCVFALTPSNAAYDDAGGTGLVSIATSGNCPWSVDNTNGWITINTDTNGLGNGSFGYAVAANSTHIARTGVVRISGEDYTVTQAGVPCVFTITPTNRTQGPGVETNSVAITADAGCSWNVGNSNGWINLLSASSGSGNGSLTYSLDANPTILPRTGVVIIAGFAYTVTQQGAACSYRLSPTNRTHGFGAATGSVSVTALAGCNWNVVNLNDWITITSAANGIGDGSVAYAITANTNLIARTGLVQIADQTLTLVQQAAVCSFTVSPTSRTHGNGNVTNSISVTTLAGCAWTAATTNNWLAFLTSTNVTGSGSVTYMAQTNESLFWRTGHLFVADRVVTLAQRPTPCTYLLSPSNAVHGAGAEGGFVSVTAPGNCPWTVSNTNDWMTIAPDTNGLGNGSFSYELTANPFVVPRTGLVTVADQLLTVVQDGTACVYALSPTGRAHGSGAETGSVDVTTVAGCAWTVSNTNTWISIISATNGSGDGTVAYTTAANLEASTRSGVITIGGQDFAVSQAGATCTYALVPSSRSHGANAETGSVSVTTIAGCAWSATTTNNWITITAGATGSGGGSVAYAVTANPVSIARTGFITVGGQTFTVSQAGIACAFAIVPSSRNHGAGAASGTVDVTTLAGCAWTVSNTNAWIAITSGTNGAGNGTVAYSVASNGTAIARSGVVQIGLAGSPQGQAYTVTQDGAACSFAIAPSGRAHGANVETNTVTVTALVGCAWTVNNNSPWITILSGGSGSGNGVVTYTATANPASVGRTGSVDIAGQTYTVTQVAAPCTYSISPATWVHQPSSGTGMVSVTTPAGCTWTVSNTNSWVTLTSGTSGTGNGTVTYTVTAHAGVNDRLGVMMVAGQSFVVSQLGSGCTYRLSPTNRFHGSSAVANTVSVIASNGCSWSVINTNSWITILSNASGSGNAVVGYAIAANSSPVQRFGALNIGGGFLTITQWGTNCGVAVTPLARAHGSGSETGLVTISTSNSNCTWAVVNTNSWITINSPAGGSPSSNGNGSFGYTVASNSGFGTRSGVIGVNGESFTVSQTGPPCAYAIAPTNRTHGAGSESDSVSVTAGAGCAWSVVNTNGWITINSGFSGSGNGTVNYTAGANPSGLARSGVLVIGPPGGAQARNYAVSQSGAPCLFVLSPTNRNHGASAETGLVTVTTISGCAWTVDNTNDWITITSATNGSGSGSVGYAVGANPGSLVRSGVVTIAGRAFTVTQDGVPCTFAISPVRRDHAASMETGMVSVTSAIGCAWTVNNTNSWITIVSGTNGSGSANVAYAVGGNGSFIGRTGLVFVAGQSFTVTQPGVNCSFTLVPATRSHGSGAETGTVGVATLAGCAWTAVNTNAWITITSGASGSGSGSVGYSLAANPASTARSGVMSIGGQNFTVSQAGLICTYAITPAARSHGTNAENGSVDVSTSAGCAWTVVNTNSWITITSGDSGNGNGTVNYSVTGNAGPPRSGNLVVGPAGGAQQVFAVVQTSALRLLRVVPMNVSLGQTNKLLVVLDAAGDESGLGFSLCYNTNMLTYVRAVRGREATDSNATLNVNTGSTNRGRLGIGMALPPDTAFSAGSNTIVEVSFRSAGQAVAGPTVVSICSTPIPRDIVNVLALPVPASYADGAVTLLGNCSYSLAAGSASFDENGDPAGGSQGSVGVTAGPGCAWSVSNTNTWIAITSSASGSGNGTVNFSVSPNPETAGRSGALVIGGQGGPPQVFTVTQTGVPCTFVIVPADQDHSSAAESGSFSLTTLNGCSWATSNTNGWINITAGASGTGSASVNYDVNANPSSFARTGVVMIAGQACTVRQTGVPCVFGISPASRAHGSGTETGLVTVTTAAGCVWVVNGASSWITITAGGSGMGNGTVGYRASFNPNLTARTGTVSIAGQTFTVTQPGNPCAVTLTPANFTHTASAETGQVAVAASGGCAWTVSNTNNWITITSNTNGTANGTVRYSVSMNPSGAPRSGLLNISGQFFTVNQVGAACVYAIAPSERSHGHVTESNTVSVATFPGCAWTVGNTNNWITITSSTNGSGSGSVNYTAGANPSGFARTGLVMIAGNPFAVVQSGAPCTYMISPASRQHGFGAESGTVTLASVFGCAWAVINTNSWIAITSETNGTGPWGVSYSVGANPAGIARTGVVSIANQPYTVSQAAAPCTFTVTPTNRVHGHGATTGTVSVTTLAGCNWSVANTTPWIAILSPTGNAGPGAVTYAVEENTTMFGRTGTVSIAGLTLTLTQLGAPCTYDISPTNRTHGYTAATGTVSVTSVTGCPWTVGNTNNWITLLSGTNGTGSLTFTYAVTENPSSYSRTGIVQIAGQWLTLGQAGAPCMFTFSPPAGVHTAAAQAALVTVTTAQGCPWTVSNTNSWITITTATNGMGNGSVGYLLASNALPAERTGVVMIAEQAYTVSQSGMVCVFTLSPTNGSLSSGNVTGLVSVTTSPLCSWVVVNTNAWISIKSGGSGTGNGLVRYTAAANPNPSLRTGTMTIGGVPFAVSQSGTPCTYSLSPSNRLHGSGLETNMVNVLTVGECMWSVVNTNPWITILAGTNGAGNGIVNYFVEPNPSSLDRTGLVSIAGQNFPMIQLGAACLYTLAPAGHELDFLSATGSITVTATIGCPWTVVNTNSWITINSGASGTTTGVVNYAVAANYTPLLRSGFLRIGNQYFSVMQTGIVCTFAIAPTNRVHGSGSETGMVSVLTSNLCPWTVSTTNTWITLLSSTNGAGNASVTYAVSGNPSPVPRTGRLTVAGQAYDVTQAGFTCMYALNPPARTHAFGAVTGLVSVATSNLCSWTFGSTNSWITFLGTTNRSNSGFVTYVVSMNPGLSPRTGIASIAGQPFTVTQYGVPFIAAPDKTVECGALWAFDPPVPSGTCGGSSPEGTNHTLTILSTTTTPGCGSAYSSTRRWDALDACSNRMTVTQMVSVVVTAPPTITCAPTKTVQCGTAWTFDTPTAIDACGGTNVTIQIVSTVNLPGGGCGGSSTSIRQWQATDGCGNQAMCSQTVLVVDSTPPALVCAPNKTVQCGSAWSFDAPVASDTCGGTNVTVQVLSTVTNTAGACGGTFTVTRAWEAADGCTNRATCSQTVTVIDTTPPVITCPAGKVVECASAWNFDAPVAADGCGGTNVTVRVFSTITNVAGACGNTFIATRTWEAIDGCSNRSTCFQTVTVVDTTPPALTCPATKNVEFGSAWSFDAPAATDICGTNVTLRIVSTVTNNAGFCGNTYGVTRTWEAIDVCSNRSAMCSQLVRVVDTTAPTLTCAVNKMVSCLSAWTFDPPTALDAADGTNVTISIISTVTNGTCASGFTAMRMWRATDSCGNASAICSQTVSAMSQASVAGTVSYHPTNYPAAAPTAKRLSPVPITVTGATNLTTQTAADGTYNVTMLAGGNYTFTPRLTNSNPVANGVSTLDISLIRRHILNIASLDTPYKLLAGDVNASRSVTTLDISFIRRLILGVTNNLPLGLWRFVPSDHVFADPLIPWDAPTNRNYPSLVMPVTGQDFMAIKLGDVNNSWAPPVSLSGFAPASARSANLALAPEVTFIVSSHTNHPGDTVAAQITAGGFRDVTSAQWTLAWDPAVLRYTGTGKYGLKGLAAGNFGTSLTGSGRLTFSWDDPDALGVTAADGTTVFAVNFEVIGAAGSGSPLWLAGSVTETEVSVNFAEANLRAVSGQVTVAGASGDLPPQPQLARAVYTNGVFGVPQQTIAGRRYILEYTDSLPTTNWTPLPAVTGDGSVLILSDPGATSRQRFYRLRIE